MEFKKIESSTINSVSYNKEEHRLIVKFKQGTYYEYLGVPEYVYIRLIQAKSAGKYFNDNIKTKYPFKVLKTEEVEVQSETN